MAATPIYFAKPFPIYRLVSSTEQCLLYDINIISWLRSEQHVVGVFVGSLPQVPSQNVFHGLPLALQLEEIQFLVEQGLACVVDDSAHHQADYRQRSRSRIKEFKCTVRRDGLTLAQTLQQEKESKAKLALDKSNLLKENTRSAQWTDDSGTTCQAQDKQEPQGSLIQPRPSSHPTQDWQNTVALTLQPWMNTPVDSSFRMSDRDFTTASSWPVCNANSYLLFKHLHQIGFYLTPGLRFGCEYSIYPGDPLRFHSHFLARGFDWDEELDLHDLVGGGRLGTAVKKGWLIGGAKSLELVDSQDQAQVDSHSSPEETLEVRTFCIEWGGL